MNGSRCGQPAEKGTAGACATPPVAPDPVPPSVLLARFDGDVEVLTQLAEIFLADSRERLDEIRRAAVERDAEALRRSAHTMKGSIGVFTEEGAFEAAERLEALARHGDLAEAADAYCALEREMDRLLPTLVALAGSQ